MCVSRSSLKAFKTLKELIEQKFKNIIESIQQITDQYITEFITPKVFKHNKFLRILRTRPPITMH